MASVLFTIGCGVATALLLLLVLTLKFPSIAIWPTPGPKTWQSYVFWPLFRSLNVLCFAVAATDTSVVFGLPPWAQGAKLVVLVASVALFAYAFRVLGRDNSYCATDGLVTGGIYRWSRNPQNAMLIVVYAALGLASDGVRAYILCAAMMSVYALMVLLEEPWLKTSYGEAYVRYCSRVPRFFNLRRGVIVARAFFRRLGGGGRTQTTAAHG